MMKLPAIDIDLLIQIEPDTVVSYLDSQGWAKTEEKFQPQRTIWKYSLDNSRDAFVMLPMDKTIPDFSYRIYDLIRVLAIVEKRSEFDLYDSFCSTQKANGFAGIR